MPDRPVLFLSECHADTALIRFLFSDPKLSIHETGCPEVARTMLSSKAGDYNLIGIVDNDKKLNIHCKGFFKSFDVSQERDKLILKKNFSTNQSIIIIDKAIETFILWNASQVDIDMFDYGFAVDPKRLGDQFKSPSIETDPEYLRLLTDLRTRQAPGILTLERLLNDLITT